MWRILLLPQWNEARNNCRGMNSQPSGPDTDLVSPDTAEVSIALLLAQITKLKLLTYSNLVADQYKEIR